MVSFNSELDVAPHHPKPRTNTHYYNMSSLKVTTLRRFTFSILFAFGSSVCVFGDPVWNNSLGWISLQSLKPQAVQGSKWFRDSLSMKDPIKVLGKRYQQEQYIRSYTNGELTYSPSLGRKITGFRAFVGLLDGGTMGSVIFKLKADDKIVFTSELISHAKGNSQKIEVAFPSASSVTLITDSNGGDKQDWSVWLEPQIRTGK